MFARTRQIGIEPALAFLRVNPERAQRGGVARLGGALVPLQRGLLILGDARAALIERGEIDLRGAIAVLGRGREQCERLAVAPGREMAARNIRLRAWIAGVGGFLAHAVCLARAFLKTAFAGALEEAQLIERERIACIGGGLARLARNECVLRQPFAISAREAQQNTAKPVASARVALDRVDRSVLERGCDQLVRAQRADFFRGKAVKFIGARRFWFFCRFFGRRRLARCEQPGPVLSGRVTEEGDHDDRAADDAGGAPAAAQVGALGRSGRDGTLLAAQMFDRERHPLERFIALGARPVRQVMCRRAGDRACSRLEARLHQHAARRGGDGVSTHGLILERGGAPDRDERLCFGRERVAAGGGALAGQEVHVPGDIEAPPLQGVGQMLGARAIRGGIGDEDVGQSWPPGGVLEAVAGAGHPAFGAWGSDFLTAPCHGSGVMLFLLNDRVLDLGEPAETLLRLGTADPARLPRTSQIVAMGQDAAFASANFSQGHPDMMLSIAAMIALTSEANCALFVAPPGARSARQVGVQFAFAPLTTMAFLKDAESKGALTPAMINAHVWRLAGRAGAA